MVCQSTQVVFSSNKREITTSKWLQRPTPGGFTTAPFLVPPIQPVEFRKAQFPVSWVDKIAYQERCKTECFLYNNISASVRTQSPAAGTVLARVETTPTKWRSAVKHTKLSLMLLIKKGWRLCSKKWLSFWGKGKTRVTSAVLLKNILQLQASAEVITVLGSNLQLIEVIFDERGFPFLVGLHRMVRAWGAVLYSMRLEYCHK